MTTTLESLKAEQERLAAMIAVLEQATQTPFFEYRGQRIDLRQGEKYVATLTTPCGTRNYHLILLPNLAEQMDWDSAKDWAGAAGGELPDRVESALLFAHRKSDFAEAAYWTREQHASASGSAWYQDFGNGNQPCSNSNPKLRARAVRRVAV